MKKVLASITRYVFGAFGIVVLGLLMTLTYQALGRIFPAHFENQIWGLVLFDIAAMCWALAFVFGSETVGQYAIAGIGFAVGFLGTLLMVASEVVLGQNLITTDASQVGQWMVYGFIGATILHAILLYAHPAAGPEIRQKIDVGIAKGEVTSEAIKQATAMLDVEKEQLARTISNNIINQAKRDLGLYPIQDTVFDRRRAETQAPPLPFPTVDEPHTVDWHVEQIEKEEAIRAEVPFGMWNPNDPNDSPFKRSRPEVHQALTQANKEAGQQPSPFQGYEPE